MSEQREEVLRLAGEAEELAKKLPEGNWTFEWDEELGEYGTVHLSAPIIRGLGWLEFDVHALQAEENQQKEPQILEFIAWCKQGAPGLAASLREMVGEAAGHEEASELHWNLAKKYHKDYLAEVRRNEELSARLERVEKALSQALRQWCMYANDDRQVEGDWIEDADDPEAVLYRDTCAALPDTGKGE